MTATEPLHTLKEEHEALRALCDDLKNRVRTGRWDVCDAIWDDFASRLEAHMRIEERELFGQEAMRGHTEHAIVEKLRKEHAELRDAIEHVGLRIQLREVRVAEIDALVASLEAHASFEDQVLYPWASSLELSDTPLSDAPTR